MVKVDISLDELLETRVRLVKEIKDKLTQDDKDFLISFVSNRPDWSKIRESKLKDYPSVKWKMMNQEKMSDKKLEEYVFLVEEVLKRMR
jgi:hypothetical protein